VTFTLHFDLRESHSKFRFTALKCCAYSAHDKQYQITQQLQREIQDSGVRVLQATSGGPSGSERNGTPQVLLV
jgi:hypothetical protein